MDLILLQDVTMTVILLVAIVTSRNSRLCVCNAAKKTLNEILACSQICVDVAPWIEADNQTLSGFFLFKQLYKCKSYASKEIKISHGRACKWEILPLLSSSCHGVPSFTMTGGKDLSPIWILCSFDLLFFLIIHSTLNSVRTLQSDIRS